MDKTPSRVCPFSVGLWYACLCHKKKRMKEALIPMAINLKRGENIHFRMNPRVKSAIRVEAELMNISISDYMNMLCLADLHHKQKLACALGEDTMNQISYAFQIQEAGEEV